MNNNNNNKPKSRSFRRRERRGVGAIIGGVILAGIILTTVFAFFVTILQNETARTSYEIQSQDQSREKDTEIYAVERDITISGGAVDVSVDNTGSIPMVASHALLYCSSCADPGKPIQDQDVTAVLNPGDSTPITVGGAGAMMTTGNTYTISVISERGNIISSTTCTVDADDTCSEDSPGLDELVEGIVQGTGHLQLDFPSFGVLFPQYQDRNGVDQAGWLARASNATGYPAFMVPTGPQTYFVDRVRFLNDDGITLNLGRTSGMTISQGKCTAGQCPPIYLCTANNDANGNLVEGSVAALNDPTTTVSIPATPLDADKYDGWQDIAICSSRQNGVNAWNVQAQMTNINSAFMVARGSYGGTNFNYAQTIPYQSIIVANHLAAVNYAVSGVNDPSMISCLLATDANTSCTVPTSATNPAGAKYQGAAGTTVWVHVNGANCACGHSVSWIYPTTGHVTSLATSLALNGNNNLNTAITIPTTMEDGSTAIVPGYYTMMLSTGYNGPDSNNSYNQGVYYFTFQVT